MTKNRRNRHDQRAHDQKRARWFAGVITATTALIVGTMVTSFSSLPVSAQTINRTLRMTGLTANGTGYTANGVSVDIADLGVIPGPTVSGRVLIRMTNGSPINYSQIDGPPNFAMTPASSFVVDTELLSNGFHWIGSGYYFVVNNSTPKGLRLTSPGGGVRIAQTGNKRGSSPVPFLADDVMTLSSGESVKSFDVEGDGFHDPDYGAVFGGGPVLCGTGLAGSIITVSVNLSQICGPYTVAGVTQPLSMQPSVGIIVQQKDLPITYPKGQGGANVKTRSVPVRILAHNGFPYVQSVKVRTVTGQPGKYKLGPIGDLANQTVEGKVLITTTMDPRTQYVVRDSRIGFSEPPLKNTPGNPPGLPWMIRRNQPTAQMDRNTTSFVLNTTLLSNGNQTFDTFVQHPFPQSSIIENGIPFSIRNGQSFAPTLLRQGTTIQGDITWNSSDTIGLSVDADVTTMRADPLRWLTPNQTQPYHPPFFGTPDSSSRYGAPYLTCTPVSLSPSVTRLVLPLDTPCSPVYVVPTLGAGDGLVVQLEHTPISALDPTTGTTSTYPAMNVQHYAYDINRSCIPLGC